MTAVPEVYLEMLDDASLDNAARLARDAGALLALGSIPSAYALAVLATEEAGKALLCRKASATGMRRDEFSRRIRRHQEKLEAVQHARELLGTLDRVISTLGTGAPAPSEEQPGEFWPRVEQLAASEHAQKMSGLYVDLGHDYTIRSPEDVITEDEARAAVEVASALAEVLRR
jgi:AbiV family abortive infection protein